MLPMFTILTDPPPEGLRAKLRQLCTPRKIGGHYAVTRSILNGLDKLKIQYRYNPPFEYLISSHVWALAGVDTLAYAIKLKNAGRIKYLAAGPNISVLPSWDNDILAHKAVDLCITNSDWTKTAYEEDSPALAGRIRIWPAGVDGLYWNPEKQPVKTKGQVLIYSKSTDAPLDDVVNLLAELGFRHTILQYGSYSPEEYRNSLAESAFAVFLSKSESQGLALAEAWAMDVPTFVWNPGWFRYEGHLFSNISAAPYLTDQTGQFWVDVHELRRVIRTWQNGEARYTPRSWVLAHMTDSISAKRLIEILFPGHVRMRKNCLKADRLRG